MFETKTGAVMCVLMTREGMSAKMTTLCYISYNIFYIHFYLISFNMFFE